MAYRDMCGSIRCKQASVSESDDSHRSMVPVYTSTTMAKPDQSPLSSSFGIYDARCCLAPEDRQMSFRPPCQTTTMANTTKQASPPSSCPSSPRSINSDVYNTSQSSQSWKSFDRASQGIPIRSGPPPMSPHPSAAARDLADSDLLELPPNVLVERLDVESDGQQDLSVQAPRENVSRPAAQARADSDYPRNSLVENQQGHITTETADHCGVPTMQLLTSDSPEDDQDPDDYSAVSENLSNEDADQILHHALHIAYGSELRELPLPEGYGRREVFQFIQSLGMVLDRTSLVTIPAIQANPGGSQNAPYVGPAEGTGQAGQAPKGQKRHAGGGDGDDGDTVEGNDQGVPAKKHKTKDVREELQNLRLSCPYRKRNPHRFNIREHESCAFTFYSDFSALKQHIIRKHSRKTHGKYRCTRCNTDFDDHSRFLGHIHAPRDQICESAPLDPEDGIDMPTSNQLLSRQGLTPNATTQAKWKDIWKVLFPSEHGGEIPNHEFHAPIEHFEVGKTFTEQVPALRADLQRGLNDLAFVETLSQIFQQRFLEVMESCNRRARTMTYNNRRNQAPGNRRPNARAASNNNGGRPYSEDSGIGMQSLAESNRVPGWLAGAGGSFPAILPNNQPELSRSSSRGSSYVNNYHPYQAMGNPQYYNPYATTNPDAAANSIARFNSSFTQPSVQRNRVSISSESMLRPLANPHINTEMLQSVDPHTQLNVPDNLELQDDLSMLDPLQVASLNPRPGSDFRQMGFPNAMDLGNSEMQIPDPQQVTVFSMADAGFMDGALPGAGLQGGGQEHRQ